MARAGVRRQLDPGDCGGALFTDESADDYHLRATSPAVDRGAPRADLPTDFAGLPRPQGAGFDIGAYELEDSAGTCVGDCNGDGAVTIEELVTGVAIALNQEVVTRCTRLDTDGDGTVKIDELVTAVLNALNGCGETFTRGGLAP